MTKSTQDFEFTVSPNGNFSIHLTGQLRLACRMCGELSQLREISWLRIEKPVPGAPIYLELYTIHGVVTPYDDLNANIQVVRDWLQEWGRRNKLFSVSNGPTYQVNGWRRSTPLSGGVVCQWGEFDPFFTLHLHPNYHNQSVLTGIIFRQPGVTQVVWDAERGCYRAYFHEDYQPEDLAPKVLGEVARVISLGESFKAFGKLDNP
jgi:hypothetical protein